MNLIRFNPFSNQSNGLNNFMEDFFNNSISDFVGSDFVSNQPAVNISETKDAYELALAAPGLKKEDFQINIEKNRLIIKVEKTIDEEATTINYKRREFGFNHFSRSFQLTEKIDQSKVAASYVDGILKLELQKKEASKLAEQVRNIDIK